MNLEMAEEKETPKEKSLRQQTESQVLTLITASFGFVAALAWNQAVQDIINTTLKPLFGKNIGAIFSLIYAIIVTVIVVIVTVFVTRVLKKD
jgi:small-conductance mechanosensitive channel